MLVYLYKNLNFSKTKAAFMGPVYWPVLYTGYLLRRKQFLNRARKQKRWLISLASNIDRKFAC